MEIKDYSREIRATQVSCERTITGSEVIKTRESSAEASRAKNERLEDGKVEKPQEMRKWTTFLVKGEIVLCSLPFPGWG